jgi:hypothetical protein
MNRKGSILTKISTCFFLFAVLAMYIFTGTTVVVAGSIDRVELLQGHIEPGATIVYTLPGLERAGNEKLIKKIDNYTIWAYPLLYVAAFILFISLFGLS